MMRRALVAAVLFTGSILASGCCTDCMNGRQGLFRSLPPQAEHQCDTCDDGGCDRCAAATPLDSVRQMFSHHAGCGEVYWDEWLSDPPACKDPCDDCGNWIGPQSGLPPRMQSWRNLRGFRYTDRCDYCDSSGGYTVQQREVIYEGPAVETIPPRKEAKPQASVLKRSAAVQPYYVPQTAALRTTLQTR